MVGFLLFFDLNDFTVHDIFSGRCELRLPPGLTSCTSPGLSVSRAKSDNMVGFSGNRVRYSNMPSFAYSNIRWPSPT